MEPINVIESEVESFIDYEFVGARRDISAYGENIDADVQSTVKFLW